MLDLKRFLRFEISGYVAVLYAFLFCVAFYDLEKIKELALLTNVKLLDYSVTGFILSAPLGFVMHQIDISLFSPFQRKRLFGGKRKVIGEIETLIGDKKNEFSDSKYQAILEFALSKEGFSNIDKEIGNRYSYYYARMEAALFSPIFGLLLFLLSTYCITKSGVICYSQLINVSINTGIIFVAILLISLMMLRYCPTLFKEINDLECLAVKQLKKDEINKLYQTKS